MILTLLTSSLVSASVDTTVFSYCNNAPVIPVRPLFTADYELVGVSVLFRHGARTSLYDGICFNGESSHYQCSPSSNTNVASKMSPLSRSVCVAGQLLPRAKGQFAIVASWLKRNYAGFFSDPSEIFARSTDLQRASSSMNILLEELFGDEFKINVKTMDIFSDALALAFRTDQIDELEKQFGVSTEHLNLINSEQHKICEKLWEGWTGSHMNSMDTAMDCALSAECVGAAYPVIEKIPNNLLQCLMNMEFGDRQIWFGYKTGSFQKRALERCRLAVAPVVRELIEALRTKKTSLWATHDSTIICLLQSISSVHNEIKWDGGIPGYAELLVFEKFVRLGASVQTDENTIIRVLRQGTVLGVIALSDLVRITV